MSRAGLAAIRAGVRKREAARKAALNGNGNGHFTEAVKVELNHITTTISTLSSRKALLEQLL